MVNPDLDKWKMENLTRICRALVNKYGVNGELRLSTQDLYAEGIFLKRLEIDERIGSHELVLKVINESGPE